MASSKITPFPIHGLVPYGGALYMITRGEVFRGDRLYRLHREVNGRWEQRVLINHWDLLENMERAARFRVGDVVHDPVFGESTVVQRRWRFSQGAVVYAVRKVSEPSLQRVVWQTELRPISTTVSSAREGA